MRFLVWGAVYGFQTTNFIQGFQCCIWCIPIIISIWLICHVQCRFSISYLSIPGIAAHDRCNISHIFTFSFQFQCRAVPLIYITVFWQDSKRDIVIGGISGGRGCGFIIICFKISSLNFSPFLWSPFLLVPNNCNVSLSLFSLLLLWLLFSDTHNQCNYVITYYSFMYYLLEEHLLLPYQFWFC